MGACRTRSGSGGRANANASPSLCPRTGRRRPRHAWRSRWGVRRGSVSSSSQRRRRRGCGAPRTVCADVVRPRSPMARRPSAGGCWKVAGRPSSRTSRGQACTCAVSAPARITCPASHPSVRCRWLSSDRTGGRSPGPFDGWSPASMAHPSAAVSSPQSPRRWPLVWARSWRSWRSSSPDVRLSMCRRGRTCSASLTRCPRSSPSTTPCPIPTLPSGWSDSSNRTPWSVQASLSARWTNRHERGIPSTLRLM